jgi:hypothetical protein
MAASQLPKSRISNRGTAFFSLSLDSAVNSRDLESWNHETQLVLCIQPPVNITIPGAIRLGHATLRNTQYPIDVHVCDVFFITISGFLFIDRNNPSVAMVAVLNSI